MECSDVSRFFSSWSFHSVLSCRLGDIKRLVDDAPKKRKTFPLCFEFGKRPSCCDSQRAWRSRRAQTGSARETTRPKWSRLENEMFGARYGAVAIDTLFKVCHSGGIAHERSGVAPIVASGFFRTQITRGSSSRRAI